MSYEIFCLSDRQAWKARAAAWFASKWNVPESAYLESMEASFAPGAAVPMWVLCLDGEKIVGGMGVIENDFHSRPDLTPNVCAVFTEPEYRKQGIAGALLDFVCEEMALRGVDTLYLLTDHTGFYERYGWEFFESVDGSRMYVHRREPDASRTVDRESYYRKGVFRHFTEDCKCSVSMTARLDVTALRDFSVRTGTKFYLNFLYVLSRSLNAREDYRMGYLWQTDELICWNRIHPMQYIFHPETETCTPVYSRYSENYRVFYRHAAADAEQAKRSAVYGLDAANHPNWFDASYIPWVSYDSMNIELPDGYLYFAPIVNWGRYREECGRLLMPVTVRMNHAVADGYLVSKVFRLLEENMKRLCDGEI